MTLYIADKKLNNFMECIDMKHKYKYFVSIKSVVFKTNTIVNEDYFMNIINKSMDKLDFCIPAIEFCGVIYCHDSVCELSDGINTFFIKPIK